MTDFNDFEEAYEVTKTIEIVTNRDFDGSGGPTTIRIEILRCLQSGKYCVRELMHTSFRQQPSYPILKGEFATKEGDFAVWVPLPDMPWVDENTEDQAVKRALGWLKDRGA